MIEFNSCAKMVEKHLVGAAGKACRWLCICVDLHRSIDFGDVDGGFDKEKFSFLDGGRRSGGCSGG